MSECIDIKKAWIDYNIGWRKYKGKSMVPPKISKEFLAGYKAGHAAAKEKQ